MGRGSRACCRLVAFLDATIITEANQDRFLYAPCESAHMTESGWAT